MLDVSELDIYRKYMELIFYTENILRKYPKYEKLALVSSIKNSTYKGIELIIRCFKCYKKEDKLRCLNELDIMLKTIGVFIRVSYKNKYINGNNYKAWSRYLFNISNLLGGWINKCLKK